MKIAETSNHKLSYKFKDNYIDENENDEKK